MLKGTVFLPEKEAPSKELSMSMQLGWVKNFSGYQYILLLVPSQVLLQ